MFVMFDLDNTLGDRSAAVNVWLDEFALAHGLDDQTRDWIASLDRDGYAPRVDVIEQIRQRLSLPGHTDELLAAYRRRVVELTRPTPGAEDCLRDLRRKGHKLAIVTNGSSEQQHAKINHFGFASLVDAVIVSRDHNIKKPDPRIFEIAAGAARASLTDAWMVGDSPVHDIAAASDLGVQTIWIRRGREWKLDRVSPTHIVDTPREIIALVP